MSNRGRKFPGAVLSTAEVRQLLRHCNRGATGDRNRALLATIWRAGLRVSEALALKPADLAPAAGLLFVRRGKGGRPRTCGLDPEAFGVVGVWLARRAGLGLNGHAPLFCTLRGRPLKDAYCRAMLKRVARRAGITRRVHLHALRHTFAVQALGEGVALHELQAQLGHADLGTTGLYLRHVRPEDLAARARARPSWSGGTGGELEDPLS